MDEPFELRKLAVWYRAFAEVGHPDYREERLEWADELEEMADEFERLATKKRP
jgi:hypothetical protein